LVEVPHGCREKNLSLFSSLKALHEREKKRVAVRERESITRFFLGFEVLHQGTTKKKKKKMLVTVRKKKERNKAVVCPSKREVCTFVFSFREKSLLLYIRFGCIGALGSY
jgi:hypothetical protein